MQVCTLHKIKNHVHTVINRMKNDPLLYIQAKKTSEESTFLPFKKCAKSLFPTLQMHKYTSYIFISAYFAYLK